MVKVCNLQPDDALTSPPPLLDTRSDRQVADGIVKSHVALQTRAL
jgi:hypothetical protein